MRIEYSGTSLESILNFHVIRPIDFIYLEPEEFDSWIKEAEGKDIIDGQKTYWFTVKNCDIVFYLDQDV